MTSLKSGFGSVLCWGHQNVECCAEMASELILLLSTGAVCCLCRLCRGERQSCCANLVTSEITTTVVWLTGKITLEKDSAEAPKKVGLDYYMAGLMMRRSHVMVLLWCELPESFHFAIFWKDTLSPYFLYFGKAHLPVQATPYNFTF